MANRPLQLVGQRFGRLTVIAHDGKDRKGNWRWLCRCDCGVTKTVVGRSLTGGSTQSCGCLGRERSASARLIYDVPPGLSSSPEYRVWHPMMSRCMNPDHKDYPDYGGRGIAICDRWMSFANFYKDMSPRPPGHSIDRIDNSEGYHCGHCDDCRAHNWAANCRWATPAQQSRNRRTNVVLQVDGQSEILEDAAKKAGLWPSTVKRRIESGMSHDDALSIPPRTTNGHSKRSGGGN